MAASGQNVHTFLPGFRAIVGTELESRESFYSQYFNTRSSNRASEKAFAAAGLPVAQLKPEREGFPLANAIEGGTKEVTFDETWGIGVEYSEEEWDDDLYAPGKSAADMGMGSSPRGTMLSPIRAGAQGISGALAERVEIEAHRIFTSVAFGSDTTFSVLPSNLGAFFRTDHPVITGALGSTQANEPSTAVALSVTALRAALRAFVNYTNDQGLRTPFFHTPEKLIYGPNLMHIAPEVVNNPTRADLPESNVKNVTAGALSLSMTPYISTNFWFIQAQKHDLDFWWRWRPRVRSYDDPGTGTMVFVGYERFKVQPLHWRGMYGSNPS